jgi:F0F1-type ATP synthase gamma subunit
MTQENIDIRKSLLISIQNALLGMIYPSIRAVFVSFDKKNKLKVIVYLESSPTEDDFENLSEITTEVLADIEFENVEEICQKYTGALSEISYLGTCVYMRKE